VTSARLQTEQQWAIAAGAQVVLLTTLSARIGLGPAGWLGGTAYAVGLCALVTGAMRRARIDTLGPADLVTLSRAVLVGGVTALVADRLWSGGSVPAAPLVVIAAVALVLDAVDGPVARRSGTASALGARFDMEVDSFLVLVLSVYVAVLLGPWVLAAGAIRYAFVAAGWVAPWLRSSLPISYSAKAVAALQGIVLVVAAADVLPRPLAAALVGVALALLVWSFGRSGVWLRRHARVPTTEGGPERTPDDGAATRTGGGLRGLPAGGRRVLAWVTTAVAGGLVLVGLVAPTELSDLTPGAFVRIPAEGLVGVALILLLPGRARRVVAALAGVALGMLTILKILDMGFFAVLGRPFDPVTDWTTFAPGLEYLNGSSGRAAEIGAMAGAVVLATAVLVLMTGSVLRLSHLVHRRKTAATRSLLVLGTAWVICALLGAQLVPNVPVAAASAAALVHDRTVQVRADLRDAQVFAAEAGVDDFDDSPGEKLLTALRGKDVVVAFVESYGRDAVEDPEYAQVGALLDAGSRRLAAAGFSSRSTFLTSPTMGGYSWLAHSTFLSGLWIDSQQRYRTLVSGDRLTLTGAFRRAGWRTVAFVPGTTRAWPEAGFFGYDQVYAFHDLGYRGPDHGWPTVPDQYTLSEFERREHARPDRPPLMAEIVLATSHAPWPFTPRITGWDDVGDGSVFEAMPATGGPPDAIWAQDQTQVRTEYRRSIEYTLGCLVSYVETYGDDDLVLIFLGDHQPPVITDAGASHDVPVAIVARDPAVVERIDEWGWQEGLKPGPQAPVWRMDAFRDRFLTTFEH
jgi:phosphatidylglycerophosphate synthase